MQNDIEKNPWTTLSTKAIYSNPWISVREDQVINPKGGKGIYGVVSFKNIALGIVPLDEHLNTWLVGQYRYALNEYSWEIPMGGGTIGADILQSAQRELKEETGYTAHKWTNIGRIHTSNSVTDEEGFLFLAQELEEGEWEPEDTEELAVKKLPLKEAVELCMNGSITDSMSIAGILKAARIMGV